MFNGQNTENELRALYNYMEGEYKEIKKRIYNEADLKDYLLDFQMPYGIKDLIQHTMDFEGFIRRAKETGAISRAVETLLARKFNRGKQDLVDVTEALEATEEPKYIELADKMKKVHSTRSAKEARDKKRAEFLLEAVADGRYMPIKMNSTLVKSGKKVTVKDEMKRINKGARKEGINKRALTSKYKNVADIGVSPLRRGMVTFFRGKGEDFDAMAKRYDGIRRGVIEHRRDFITFLDKYPKLEFVQKQKLGKIR